MCITQLLRRLLDLRCEEYEYGRYKVWSEVEDDVFYLVDVLEYDAKGKCDCKNFAVNVGPVFENTHQLTAEEAATFVPLCKHIIRAKLAHADKLSHAMIKETIKHQPSCHTTHSSETRAAAE